MKWTASALVTALRRSLEAPPSKPLAGHFVSEIQAPGSSLRRADALWLPFNSASRGTIIGYETKVTRQDVLAELRDTTKADAWEQYCSRFWLVIPDEKLIDGLDVPDRWGVCVPPVAKNRRTFRVVRPAPKLSPINSTAGIGAVFAKYAYETESKLFQLTRLQDQVDRNFTERRELQRELREIQLTTGQAKPETRTEELVKDVVAEIERLSDYHAGEKDLAGAGWSVKAEDVALLVLSLQARNDGAQHILREISSLSSRARLLHENLERSVERIQRVHLPPVLPE